MTNWDYSPKSVGPWGKDEVQSFNKKFNDAIKSIKNSKSSNEARIHADKIDKTLTRIYRNTQMSAKTYEKYANRIFTALVKKQIR